MVDVGRVRPHLPPRPKLPHHPVRRPCVHRERAARLRQGPVRHQLALRQRRPSSRFLLIGATQGSFISNSPTTRVTTPSNCEPPMPRLSAGAFFCPSLALSLCF